MSLAHLSGLAGSSLVSEKQIYYNTPNTELTGTLVLKHLYHSDILHPEKEKRVAHHFIELDAPIEIAPADREKAGPYDLDEKGVTEINLAAKDRTQLQALENRRVLVSGVVHYENSVFHAEPIMAVRSVKILN